MFVSVATQLGKRAAVVVAAATLASVGLVNTASAEPHAPSPCTADVQPFLSTWSDVVDLEYGSWHPNLTNLNQDSIQVTHHRGSSRTWTSSITAGAVVGYGGSNVSATTGESNAVTFTVDQTETQTFAVPANTSMKADYVAAIAITAQGDQYKDFNCAITNKYDRVEAHVVQTGYRVSMRDVNGVDTTKYNWGTSTYTASGGF